MLFVCLFVRLLATLWKNFRTDLHQIFREGWQWANEQMIKFWRRSRSRIPIRIQISTLVRRALGEVCTVQVPSSFTMKQWLPLTHITPRQGARLPKGITRRDYIHVDEKLHRYRRQNKTTFISLTQKVHNFGISATKIK